MKNLKILYGVCGIGNGHMHRQMPIIEYYAKDNEIVIFGYGQSYDYFSKKFKDFPNIHVLEVAVPFYMGNASGLDFKATLENNTNHQKNYFEINTRALAKTQELIGKPDLVISDYEPVCAQYAYAYNVPFVTIDQQSKYLRGDFPAELGGTTYLDEINRLLMFFPKADKRIACSFFQVKESTLPKAKVEIYPSILQDTKINIKRILSEKKSFLVYLSSQKEFVQPVQEVIEILHKFPEVDFHLFTQDIKENSYKEKPGNICFYKHGDPRFINILSSIHGIVSTAGHSLLSEAMFHGIPVYAIPLSVYEQHMNAHAIGDNKFGMVEPKITEDSLHEFIKSTDKFAGAIQNDKEILLRSSGFKVIIENLESLL